MQEEIEEDKLFCLCPSCGQEVPLCELKALFNEAYLFERHCVLGVICEASGKLATTPRRLAAWAGGEGIKPRTIGNPDGSEQ